MLISAQELKNGDVISLESGSTIGLVQDPIVDPKNGQVIAFDVQTGFMAKRLILPTLDIIDWQHNAIIARGETSLIEPKDVIKVFNLIKKRFRIMRLKAFTKKGESLGRVSDIFIDSTSGMVAKYTIGRSIFLNLAEHSRIIPSSEVIKIDGKGIVFKDRVVEGDKDKAREARTAVA